MELFGQYSALIDCIYRGATDAHAWPEIVQALSLWIGAPKGLMFTPQHLPSAGGFVFPYGMPQSFLETWAARHQPTDLWTKRAFERGLTGEGLIVLDQDLVTLDELTASAWYQEFLRHQDIGRVASGIVFGQEITPKMPITAISFFRSLSDEAYTEQDRARLRLVFPHISRALGVLLTLRDAEFRVAASLSALNRLDAGVLLLNAQGSVAFVNQAGQAMLNERDGISLLEANPYRGARLSVANDATGQATESAIQLALNRSLETAHFHETILIVRPSGAPPYSLQISPLGQNAGFGLSHDGPSAIAFLVNPQRQCSPDARQLATLYDLTPAEAGVAVRLVDGENMAQLAEELGISINTLKTQVKRVYEKMGVDSRAAFVRTVLTHSSMRVH